MGVNWTKQDKAREQATKINKKVTKELKDLNFKTILQDSAKLLITSTSAKKA